MKHLFPFGIELSSLPDNAQLLEYINNHPVMLVRNSTLTDRDSFIAYASTLGEMLEWDFGSVMELQVKPSAKNYLFTNLRAPLHWDGAFHQEPRFLLFHCIEAPDQDCGGETIFVNTVDMCKKASLNDLLVWKEIAITYETEKLAHYGGKITVPLLQKHPSTGAQILRFAEPVGLDMPNPVNVSVQGMNLHQGKTFINRMKELCFAENNYYTHVWQKGDFLIADNFSLLHGRHAFKAETSRHIRRIQII